LETSPCDERGGYPGAWVTHSRTAALQRRWYFMSAAHIAILERITIDPEVRFGKPCIPGHRMTVQEILE